MFACCRCANPKKDGKTSKKDKHHDDLNDSEKSDSNGEILVKRDSVERIIPLHPENDVNRAEKDEMDKQSQDSTQRISSDDKTSEQEQIILPNGSGIKSNDPTNFSPTSDTIDEMQSKSDSSNITVEETNLVNKSKTLDKDSSDNLSNNQFVPNNQTQNQLNCLGKEKDEIKSNDTTVNGDLPKSCISRRSSSKSSIRKKVNINDSTEVIPSSELASIDDDEVFSDSIPPKLPRGDMCAPYISKPGVFPLPEWFNNDDSEFGGVLEPPVTPVGRDELELKRHRLYSELLIAAQAAVEHRVRFDPLGPDIANAEDCDPDLKPSATAELENLINRLEKLVERLERSISARELEIANRTFDSVIETKRRSFDLETAELPPLPDTTTTTICKKENLTEHLEERIEKLESSLNHINENFKRDSAQGSLDNIPTVLDEFLPEETQVRIVTENMSVAGYQAIINGPLAQYINLSNKIGGDVAQHAQLVKQAFDAQLQYVNLATQIAQPPQGRQSELLKPTSDQISAIQNFREKNRVSPFFNHLSAISESIPALGWVCVAPTPGPYIKEMNDAGQFYTNRVLKDWKEKNPTHVEWARSWIQTLTELQQYIKQYHTTGLVWSGKGGAPPPPPPSAAGCPPPPPPPVMALGDLSLGANDDRSALFAEINQGERITQNLKKVTADMQTHKNPTLRTGPAPFKAPQSFSSGGQPAAPAQQQIDKPPVFTRDGKKWIIEYHKSNPSLLVENAEMNNVVYMFRCQNSTLTVKGKVNSVVLDSCKKCSILFDSVVSSVEFVNCQSVQMQVLGKVPTISIDKTDGCQMYLSKDSLNVEIISSKSSEMNVLIPKDNGDYVEQPIPEQFKTTIKGNNLQTICVESLG